MTVSAAGQPRGNVVLERLLARAGWTPENLGDRLNELALSLNLRVRVHRRTPRRWVYAEAGRTAPRVPHDPWPSLVCHLLHERLGEPVTLDCLGWTATGPLRHVPADHGLDQPWTPRGAVAALASVVDADSMERRHFAALTGLTLTAVAHQWLFDPARVAASVLGKRVDHALVDDLERVTEARRRMDDALGGGTLLPSVRGVRSPCSIRHSLGTARACSVTSLSRVGTGAVERACATAGEAASIIRRLDSSREQRLLADFRRAAAPYAGSAAVREFDAKHRDLIGSSLT